MRMFTVKFETPIRHGEWRQAIGRLRGAATVVVVPLLASACTSIVVQNAPGALQTAESRARFELNCPEVQASVLSQKVIQGRASANSYPAAAK
jgi:hypothetical protein